MSSAGRTKAQDDSAVSSSTVNRVAEVGSRRPAPRAPRYASMTLPPLPTRLNLLSSQSHADTTQVFGEASRTQPAGGMRRSQSDIAGFGSPKSTPGRPPARLDMPARTASNNSSQKETRADIDKYKNVCSEILANTVYISGGAAASNLALLQANQITHILNMAGGRIKNAHTGTDMVYRTLYMRDNKDADAMVSFYHATSFIDEAVLDGGRVLVHCVEGISRSATIVIAFLMAYKGHSYKEARKLVQTSRPIADPNIGFTMQLINFEQRLRNGVTKPQLYEIAQLFQEDSAYFPKNVPYFLYDDLLPTNCYVVQTPGELFLWIGEKSTQQARDAANKFVGFLQRFEKANPNCVKLGHGHKLNRENIQAFRNTFGGNNQRKSTVPMMRETMKSHIVKMNPGSTAQDGLRKAFQKYDRDGKQALSRDQFHSFFNSAMRGYQKADIDAFYYRAGATRAGDTLPLSSFMGSMGFDE